MTNFQSLRLFSFCLMSLFHLAVSAQNNIQWGKPTKDNNNTQLEKIIAQDATGFYALKAKYGNDAQAEGPKSVYIEHYNREMNLTKSGEINLKWKRKKRQFEDILMLGGELYLFTSFNNQAKQKNFLFAQKLNKKTFQAAKELTYVAEIETQNKYNEGSFSFHISQDSSKVLVLNQIPTKNNQPEQFALHVYNNDFTLSWAKDISLPYDDDKFSIEDFKVDNQGNVYLLGVLYGDGSQKRRKGLPNYQYILLAYTEMGNAKEKYPITLREKFITDLTFRPAPNGELICCGFYSEAGTYSIRGTYFFKINPLTKEVSNENLKELDFDFRTEYISERKKDKLDNEDKKSELYQFSLDELILRNDGGALLVAEQFYIKEYRDYDNFNGGIGTFGQYGANTPYRTVYVYHYNDIIVINIGPDGAIEWASRIPKRQETENDGGWYSSYAMSIVGDKLNFIYNDNGKNFSSEEDDRKTIYNFNGRNSVIALSQISPDGTVTTRPLAQNREAGVITRPKVCKQIGAKEVAIFGESGRLYRFGKIVF
jgi:hypothetical protein